MSAVDIIEQQLSHLQVKVDQHQPYQWTAQSSLDRTVFQGNGFTPGAAMDMLYSVMIRHLDRAAEEAKVK